YDENANEYVCVEIERQFAKDNCRKGTQDADRYRQQHRDGNRPALIERDQEQIGKEQGEPENDGRLAFGAFFLKGGVGPGTSVALRKRAFGDLFHRLERLP